MPSGVPPGPRDWTFGFSELRKMQRDILAYWTDLHRRYGDVVYIRIGPYRSYTFFHPDAIRETIVAKAKQFRRFPKPMQVLAQWNGNSLIITEGEEWLRQRRMVQPAFHPKRFDRYAACMVDRTRNLLDRWLTRIKDETSIEVEIDRAMTDLTLDIICKTMFDAQIDAETSDVGRAVAILSEVSVKEMKSLCSFPDWLPLPGKRRKRWAMQRLDETVRRFIRERRASGEDRGDLLSMLLLAVDEEGNGGQLTDEQVRDQSMTLLIAGHDTTAAGLTWTLYCLARYPRIAAHVQQELDAVLAGRTPVAGDLPQLSLTERSREGNAASLSSRCGPACAAGTDRRRSRRLCRTQARSRSDIPLCLPSRPALVSRTAYIRPRPLPARASTEAAALRLFPLRRRPESLYWQYLCDDGNDTRRGDVVAKSGRGAGDWSGRGRAGAKDVVAAQGRRETEVDRATNRSFCSRT